MLLRSFASIGRQLMATLLILVSGTLFLDDGTTFNHTSHSHALIGFSYSCQPAERLKCKLESTPIQLPASSSFERLRSVLVDSVLLRHVSLATATLRDGTSDMPIPIQVSAHGSWIRIRAPAWKYWTVELDLYHAPSSTEIEAGSR